jgi:hypothetical protein
VIGGAYFRGALKLLRHINAGPTIRKHRNDAMKMPFGPPLRSISRF